MGLENHWCGHNFYTTQVILVKLHNLNHHHNNYILTKGHNFAMHFDKVMSLYGFICMSVQVLERVKSRISVTLVFWSGFRFLDQYLIFLSRCKWGVDLATCLLSRDMTEILLKRLKTLFQTINLYGFWKSPVFRWAIQGHYGPLV